MFFDFAERAGDVDLLSIVQNHKVSNVFGVKVGEWACHKGLFIFLSRQTAIT